MKSFKMKVLLVFCGLVCLAVSQDNFDDPPIVAETRSMDDFIEELDAATIYCYANNFQGNYNAKDLLYGTAFGAYLESGKTFIYCLMRIMNWIDDNGIFMRGKILSDVQNGLRPSSGSLSSKMSLEFLLRQCLRGITEEADDFSLSYAIARCLYNAGLQLKPQSLEIMQRPTTRRH